MDEIAIFIFFFAVIDPIGTIPVFIPVTRAYDERTKTQIAVKATLFSALILVFSSLQVRCSSMQLVFRSRHFRYSVEPSYFCSR